MATESIDMLQVPNLPLIEEEKYTKNVTLEGDLYLMEVYKQKTERGGFAITKLYDKNGNVAHTAQFSFSFN